MFLFIIIILIIIIPFSVEGITYLNKKIAKRAVEKIIGRKHIFPDS